MLCAKIDKSSKIRINLANEQLNPSLARWKLPLIKILFLDKMHEFSIAVNIVDIALENAEKAQARIINEIELEVGDLSGVVYEAMETAMEAAVKGTILENAIILIIKTEGRARCLSCLKEFALDNLFDPCPFCGTFNPDIISGKELKIKSINVD